MAFFSFKNRDSLNRPKLLLQGYADFLKTFPIQHKTFLDSFEPFFRLMGVKNGSLYFYEEKTKLFVLKKWVGAQPVKFSVSENYELIKYLKVKKNPLIKSEFSKGRHELREPALFFFQQTSSTHVLPLTLGEKWLGLFLVDLSAVPADETEWVCQLVALYAQEIVNWCVYSDVWQSQQKLLETAHVKNQLLANVSHELQTPLNGILGFSDAILETGSGETVEATRAHIQMIRDAGQNLHSTISNFLQLAQIEARKSDVKHQKANVCELIDEVAGLFADTLAKRGITLKAPGTDKPVYVFVEPDQIRTVLINLMSNAAKFTESGFVAIQLKKSGEMLHVSVTDTGIGIPLEKLDLIFEEFYQADGTHTRVYGGTGLGLAIAKKIISQHGGRIWAARHGVQGSCFTFTVPLCPGV